MAPTDGGTVYLTADMLGSTRLATGSVGGVLKCHDYMPFGEDIPSGVGPRGSCYPAGTYPTRPDVLSEKFTGQERDAESGLDHFPARYSGSAMGRFTSADPAGNFVADLTNPQSWHLYSCNPMAFVDPKPVRTRRTFPPTGLPGRVRGFTSA